MAQRTVALCDGKYIGIETIFTVIDGKQINIPEKLKEIRQKSQNNELFCPCGCGANLVLVAGDKNLREQHFRIKDGQHFEDCTAVTEGKTSVESKIVLKCWLDDNLHADDLESRVSICDVADSSRRYEFTFISRSLGIALNYCHNRANLSDEKQSVLEANSNGIRIIHVVDYMNGGFDGQYPEGLMKLQAKQKYCLLLSKKNLESSLEQQETQVRDAEGNRWIKCEYCGKIAKDAEFTSYGGKIGVHLNLGTCKECSNNLNIRKKQVEIQSISTKKYNSTVCPDCGSKLIEKNGRNGRFIGCSNFPKCYYTRSLRRY